MLSARLFAVVAFPMCAGASVIVVPTGAPDVGAAMAMAVNGDAIRVDTLQQSSTSYGFSRGLNFLGKAVSLEFGQNSSATLDRSAVVLMADGASMSFVSSLNCQGILSVPARATCAVGGQSVSFGNEAQVTVGAGGQLSLATGSLPVVVRIMEGASLITNATNSPGATVITALAGSSLSMGPSFSLNGVLVSTGGTIAGGSVTVALSSVLSLIDGTLIASSLSASGTLNLPDVLLVSRTLTLQTGGRMAASGRLFADITVGSEAQATYTGDTTAFGAYTNTGRTVIQTGTLTVVGSLTSTGQIVGNLIGPRGPGGPGLAGALGVTDSFTAAENSSILLPSASLKLRVAGSVDFAMQNDQHFDLSLATLEVGAPGGVSSLEVLSGDIGPRAAGFNRATGMYPIGTLSVLGDVHLEDRRSNSTASGSEVVYASRLVVAAGAMLRTQSHKVYCLRADILGQVDNPSNIIVVAGCAADFNRSGELTVQDLFEYLLAYFAAEPRADLNGHEGVTVQDLFEYLVAYFAGCA